MAQKYFWYIMITEFIRKRTHIANLIIALEQLTSNICSLKYTNKYVKLIFQSECQILCPSYLPKSF